MPAIFLAYQTVSVETLYEAFNTSNVKLIFLTTFYVYLKFVIPITSFRFGWLFISLCVSLIIKGFTPRI